VHVPLGGKVFGEYGRNAFHPVTFEIALLLFLVLTALVLFSTEWVQTDVVALGLVLALILSGLLTPKEAYSGFASDTVIMILGLLIMTAAMLKTGVVEMVGRAIVQRAGTNPNVLVAVILITVALLSAFISNTAAAAFFVPVAMGIAQKARVSPSRLLMPVAFSSILTSSVTLISTSTNLVVNGLMTSAGLEGMGMFELAPVGIPISIAGLIYIYFVARRWIPDRAQGDGLIERFGVRPYLTEVLILDSSPLVGKTIAEANLGRDLDLHVVRIVREKEGNLLPRPDSVLRPGDVLLVEGVPADVLKVKDTAGIEIRADVKLGDPQLKSEDAVLVEALIVPGSPLIGRTLRAVGFRERFGLQVLGLNRHGKNLLQKLSRIPLRVGDVLLLQGRKTNVAAFDEERAFSVLNRVEEKRPDPKRALRTIIIFTASLALATWNVLPISVAVLLGAFAIFAAKCIAPHEAYREVEWRAIILIACMLALGAAMTKTGTAQYLASHVAEWTQNFHPSVLLAGFFLLTVGLTQPMSNQAAAAVILPIAIQTATQMGLNPRAFVMAIAVAASCSYLTPLEPACLMVYGPGRYKFSDFLKVGSPLVVVILIITVLLIPKYWPLVLR
jgi:di/tricarboxylate transporter